MQKLPEASAKKKGRRMRKEKDRRRKIILFSAVTGEVTAPC